MKTLEPISKFLFIVSSYPVVIPAGVYPREDGGGNRYELLAHKGA